MTLLVPGLALAAVIGVGLAGGSGPAQIADGDPAPVSSTVVAPLDTTAARPTAPRRRETGTDGLMGRLPFDLPPAPVRPLVNRFTIDDVRAAWSDLDTTPPWVRRIRGFGSYTADPYQR
ncbi:MAG TPA: hypothetical protein VFK35_10450 [Candidatus Limnocylindrales bacterium]|nr:hypothetical protein [Candidatus Limnocylindrales bacterium]